MVKFNLLDGFAEMLFGSGVDHEIDFFNWREQDQSKLDKRAKVIFEKALSQYAKKDNNWLGHDLTEDEKNKVRATFDERIKDFKKMYDDAGDSGKKKASTELHFASAEQAFQYLADVTGKRVKVAGD